MKDYNCIYLSHQHINKPRGGWKEPENKGMKGERDPLARDHMYIVGQTLRGWVEL